MGASSDPTATKPPNKAGRPAAEAVERRAEAKENANRCRACRTQGRESVSQAPERVRTVARPAVKHPRWEPYAGKLHVRFCAGGALQARRTQLPEMAAAAKPSEQPRTESCVVSATAAAKRRQGGCRPECQ